MQVYYSFAFYLFFRDSYILSSSSWILASSNFSCYFLSFRFFSFLAAFSDFERLVSFFFFFFSGAAGWEISSVASIGLFADFWALFLWIWSNSSNDYFGSSEISSFCKLSVWSISRHFSIFFRSVSFSSAGTFSSSATTSYCFGDSSCGNIGRSSVSVGDFFGSIGVDCGTGVLHSSSRPWMASAMLPSNSVSNCATSSAVLSKASWAFFSFAWYLV